MAHPLLAQGGVSPWAFLLIAAGLVWIGATLWLAIAAFRISVPWGLLTLFVPFGVLVFVCRHWREGGMRFLMCIFSAMACCAIYLTHPELFLPYIQPYPALAASLRITSFTASVPDPPTNQPPGSGAADGTGNESLLTQRDDLLARQAAYDKHAAELNATYAQLKADRDKINGSGPAQRVNAAAALSTSAARAVASAKQSQAADALTTRAAMDAAVQRIRTIVNQVPLAVAKPPGAESWSYGFHPGATKPDFDHADVVSGRELWPHDFITMQGNPNVYFHGADCEFNSQTKFFYTNRELPKKRLSDAEYQELVHLYRFVGRCQRELGVTL